MSPHPAPPDAWPACTREIAGWGRFPRAACHVLSGYAPADAAAFLAGRAGRTLIARGAGRAYGDAALNRNQGVIDLTGMRRFLAFDPQTGLLHAEAGVTLQDILHTFVPRGWFLPVTPGTQYPTLGGSLACNVHGKSKESLSHHVERLHMLLADGSVTACSRRTHPDLFWATLGGMGLTGIILSAEIRLRPIASSFIRYEGVKAANLDAIFRLFEEERDAPLSVAWIDCLARGANLGRSIMMRGDFARPGDLKQAAQRRRPLQVPRKSKIPVPVEFPAWTLNPLSMLAFNTAYYAKHPARLHTVMDYDSFFYPLDTILRWNLIYGRRGMVQYQFLIPPDRSFEGVKSLLEKIAASGRASFLAVLKKFGDQPEQSTLSFPGPGYFLALDFPVGDGRILGLMDVWDREVLEYGGRIYLTKDARMKRETFEAMYPGLAAWKRVKQAVDPKGVFASDMARRLGLLESPPPSGVRRRPAPAGAGKTARKKTTARRGAKKTR